MLSIASHSGNFRQIYYQLTVTLDALTTAMSNLLYSIWQETRFYYCQPYKRIYKFNMDLIHNDWETLLLKTETSQKKNPF